ncbi:MAG: DUF2177 family protein [Alsobacter sp.]
MTAKQAAILYGLALLTMLPLDIVWLSTVGKGFYRDQIGALLLDQPRLVPAAAFYLLYGAGVVLFAVSPAVASGSALQAALWGALFGFFAYMTYDLSNLATLRGFTTAFAVVDIAWGTVMTAIVAGVTLEVARRLGII